MDNDLTVDIVMVTYNQERYIADAIKSVMMQETSFRYRLIISDDCSTDETVQICKIFADEYSDKILLLENSSNIGLVGNYKKVFDNCSAKYIAILEGDDYWTDIQKLKKQVAILEGDHAIGVVHTACNARYESSGTLNRLKIAKRIPSGYVFNEMIENNFIVSLTACFRKEYFDKYVDFKFFIANKFKTIDSPIWTELSAHSKIQYLPDITGVYRILTNSISHPLTFDKYEAFTLAGLAYKKYYFNKYDVNVKKAKIIENKILLMIFRKAVLMRNLDAINRYKNLIRINSLRSLYYWLASLWTIWAIKQSMMKKGKRRSLDE